MAEETVEKGNRKNLRGEVSHYHHCPACNQDVPAFREKKRCADPIERWCGKCTAGLFAEVQNG